MNISENCISGTTDSGNTFTVELATITPERAGRLLDANTRNRDVTVPRCKNYAGQMSEGLWHFDGNPIRVDRNGTLLDGQHRLLAIIESGCTVQALLITGLDPVVMATIDSGKSRSLKDIITIADPSVTDVNGITSVARILYIREALESMPIAINRSSASVQQNSLVNNQYIVDYYKAEKVRLERLSRYAKSVRNARKGWSGLTAAILALLRSEFEKIDYNDADAFFDHLKTGANLHDGHPVLAVIRFGDKVSTQRDKRPNAMVWAAILIKAWNKYRRGENWHTATFRAGGSQPETFPEAV